MSSPPVGAAQSWFVVKSAVAISPILIFWAAGAIEWFLRRTIWPHAEMPPPSSINPARDEPASVATPPR